MLTGIILASCGGGSVTSSGDSVIEGRIKGAEGQMVVLQRYVNNKPVDMDSSVVAQDGSFRIEPGFAMPLDYYGLSLRPANEFMILLADSSENVLVDAELGKFQNHSTVKGSPNTELLHDFYRSIEDFDKRIDAAQKSAMEARQEGEDPGPFQSEATKLTRERRQYCSQFLRDKSPSPAILAALSELNINIDLQSFEKAYTELKGNFGHSQYHKLVGDQIRLHKQQAALREKAEAQNAQAQQQQGKGGLIQVGQVAPNIQMKDPKGTTRSLEELRGKYVLIDFWASWCAPCRRENPNVVKLYNKYKGKGFDIFSVSLDNSADRWVAAIQQDNLLWPAHVSDLQGWKNEAAKLYGVSSIPQTVLLDPDGKIAGIGLRGPALEAKLKEVFGS